jgi:peptidoglycan hydrolase-like protein with peptidoglycan-binding domain
MVVRIQAGLKAFGNDEMEIDGVIGSRTKAAIREFQSLFGLPETGEPDQAVYAKMKEIGLTN